MYNRKTLRKGILHMDKLESPMVNKHGMTQSEYEDKIDRDYERVREFNMFKKRAKNY